MRGSCSSSGRYTDTTKWFHLQFGTLIKSYRCNVYYKDIEAHIRNNEIHNRNAIKEKFI